MDKERRKSEKTEKRETREAGTCPMTVREVKILIPRRRTVRPRIQVFPRKSGSITEKASTTCVTSGNTMKIYVNLMPVLASAKEEEEEDDVNSCPTEKEPGNRSKNNPSVAKSVDLKTKNTHTALISSLATETKQLPPGLVLPPLTQPKPDHQENKIRFTPQPPIMLCEQPATICSNITTKGSDDGDGRLWIDNPLLSRSRSVEFCLPDISLSSLDALLQTVTQKLARKRRGTDMAPWGRVHSDQLLVAGNEHLKEHNDRCRTEGHHVAAIAPSMPGHSVKSHMNLPPLVPPPTLILTMTKKSC
ncbi:uncharacterized protein LOC114853525 isoform X2 [Betta splendens]|uniref:Uncharacterized protein LOC114853525 isoform X2 n=1 Tax=Betta splendens TaxID=158456 RepID=A0A6P7M9G5_BETSP|nr:uncharacterized protein LOC114853525 isoform X2 [Betta splendens]